MIVLDHRGHITDWNPGAEALFGYVAAETLGRDFRALLVPERYRLAGDWPFPHQQGVHSMTAEVPLLTKSGEEFSAEMSLASGSVGGRWFTIGVFRHATQRRRSEEYYRVLFENSHDALMTVEPPNWRFTSGNPAAIRLFGARDLHDFVTREAWAFSPERRPDGRPSLDAAKQHIEQAGRDGSAVFDWLHSRLDGSKFVAKVSLTRRDLGLTPVVQATVRDISAQKRAERELIYRNIVLSTQQETSADGILVVSERGKFRGATAGSRRYGGRP